MGAIPRRHSRCPRPRPAAAPRRGAAPGVDLGGRRRVPDGAALRDEAPAPARGGRRGQARRAARAWRAPAGAKRVERRGRASRLTGAGEVVAIHAQRVLDTLEGMHEDLRALAAAERGTLALAASTTPGTYVLPAVLRRFADRHPGIDVDVVIGSSTWVAERVAHRDVQLGVAGEVDLPEGVIAEAFL